MCLEDIRLGMRRTFKVTAYGGGTASISAAPTRVVLKVGMATGSIRGGPDNGNQCVLAADSAARQTDQITIETHGTLVTSAFKFDGGAGIGSITEIFDEYLMDSVGDKLKEPIR